MKLLNKTNIVVLISITSLFGGCASKVLSPPERNVTTLNISNDDENELVAKSFHRANLQLKSGREDRGCKTYTVLKDRTDFPLAVLAKIRYYKSCKTTLDALSAFWESEQNGGEKVPRWALRHYVEVSLELAKKHNSKKWEAYFLARYSKYQTIQKEKVPLLMSALRKAPKSETEEYQTKLEDVAPRFTKVVTKENRYKVARDLEKNRKFKKARKLYRQISRSDSYSYPERIQALDRIRLSYKIERERKTYIKKTKEMVEILEKWATSNPQLVRNVVDKKIIYARVLWTDNQNRKAYGILTNLLKREDRNYIETLRIHRALSGLELEAKNYYQAIFHLHLAYQLPVKSDLHENVGWELAWTYYLARDYQTALHFFKDQKSRTDSYKYGLKLDYWIGKTLNKLGSSEDAKDIFENLTRVNEMGYYGIMARRELGADFSSIEKFSEFKDDDYRGPETIEWLLATNEKEIAKRYLRFYSYKQKGKEAIEKLLPLLHRGEVYSYGVMRFYKIKAKDRSDTLKRYASLVFPMPFKRDIQKAATRFDVPQEYIYSIIRQESAFNPKARSWADAFGLMQMIPEKAKVLSKDYRISYRSVDDLYDPQTNILLGSSLLGEQIKSYNRSFIANTAAYNAGDGPARRWFRDRFNGDYTEFIEMIPYEETQTYVKLVLRNYVNYMRFNRKDSFKFPEYLLTRP